MHILLIALCLSSTPLEKTLDAICQVESGGRDVVGDGGLARGPFQIHPIVVRDVNRILGAPVFGLADRSDPLAAREMARVYCRHYEPCGNAESWSRLWNSGPNWRAKKHLTDGYVKKVKKEMAK